MKIINQKVVLCKIVQIVQRILVIHVLMDMILAGDLVLVTLFNFQQEKILK